MASHRFDTTSTTVLVNKNGKWSKELTELCRQGYNTIPVGNFNKNLDVMIQSKPKQVVCILNGADLLFVWKRKAEIERLKEVSTFFKHSYVIVIIKHDLELAKANRIFNELPDVLNMNIELIYVNDLNEAVRYFGFIASRIAKIKAAEQNEEEVKNNEDESGDKSNSQCMLNNYLDSHQRVIDILSSIDDLSEDDVLALLHSFGSIRAIASASIERLTNRTPLTQQQIASIYKTFNTKQSQLDSA